LTSSGLAFDAISYAAVLEGILDIDEEVERMRSFLLLMEEEDEGRCILCSHQLLRH
jgi:hypothetical protein